MFFTLWSFLRRCWWRLKMLPWSPNTTRRRVMCLCTKTLQWSSSLFSMLLFSYSACVATVWYSMWSARRSRSPTPPPSIWSTWPCLTLSSRWRFLAGLHTTFVTSTGPLVTFSADWPRCFSLQIPTQVRCDGFQCAMGSFFPKTGQRNAPSQNN